MCFEFVFRFVWNISNFKKTRERYDHEVLKTASGGNSAKRNRLLSGFLDLNEGKLVEIFKRSGHNTTGHREKDVHKDRKVVDGDERSTISEIAGRKSTLVRKMPENCKEEFQMWRIPRNLCLCSSPANRSTCAFVCRKWWTKSEMSTVGVTRDSDTFVYIYDPKLKQQSPQWNPVHSISI